MNNTILVINEQHRLMPEQEELMKGRFGKWDTYKIPSTGLNLPEMVDECNNYLKRYENVVFASPVPVMIMFLSYLMGEGEHVNVVIFHNDNREKKELPNGKIIFTVAQTGWELVDISFVKSLLDVLS